MPTTRDKNDNMINQINKNNLYFMASLAPVLIYRLQIMVKQIGINGNHIAILL
jgi:hypothetical protein